ncbi:MAG: hypothetical protein JNL98_28045 [Bryobacterales bacterium]|nr:hypothetical protein [Bryobacterales bacterium]
MCPVEFQESQQRYDFLNTQRQDLLDSIRDTEKAIQEIDVETRKRFSDADGLTAGEMWHCCPARGGRQVESLGMPSGLCPALRER